MEQVKFQEDGHLYFHNGRQVPCVSDILEHFGLTDFSKVDPYILEAAQNFGTVVHQTTHLYDIDDLADCDPEVQPYLDGWIKFRHDKCISNFDVIEQPLYSKIWGFAGTPDRVYNSDLPDIKTGAKSAAHKIQTAFYKILVEENFPKIKIKHRSSVYLMPNTYKVDPHKDRSDLNIAKSLISIYNFKKKEKLL